MHWPTSLLKRPKLSAWTLRLFVMFLTIPGVCGSNAALAEDDFSPRNPNYGLRFHPGVQRDQESVSPGQNSFVNSVPTSQGFTPVVSASNFRDPNYRAPAQSYAVASDLGEFGQGGLGRNGFTGAAPDPRYVQSASRSARTLAGEQEQTWFADECEDCPRWSLMPQGLIYHSYLASEKESRFRSVWHDEKDDGLIWDITLGGRVGLLRYGSASGDRPTGWQLDIEGAGLPRLDWDTGNELIGADFRFGVPLTYGNELHQVKFAYYHLSSHVGDEFLIRNPGFMRLNYSRDVLVWGHSFTPTDTLRFYAEAGWAFYSDVGEPWEFQFGIEYRPTECTGFRGAPFVAFNGHLRQEVDFGGNFVFQAGWAWRGSPSSGLFRLGVEYFNGKDDQFSFYNEFQSKVGLGIWYDF